MRREILTAPTAAGCLLLIATLLSIARGAAAGVPAIVPGMVFWLAGSILVARVSGLQRGQTLLMLAVGLLLMGFAAINGGDLRWDKALSSNQALLSMLAAVTFLRLITVPAAGVDEADPRGAAALRRTLLGVHLFGSVINLSAVMILGDRISRRTPMTPLQAQVLSRGFAMAAHWSPFFAAMGIALSNAPGASLATLSLVGLPLAAIGLSVSAWRLGRRRGAAAFVGYPMHFGALWIPGLLAALVLLVHEWRPDIPILSVISLLALSLSACVLVVRHGVGAAGRLTDHLRNGLPRMSGELALFLAAGVLAAGIGSAVASTGWRLDLPHFGATQASVLLLLMVTVSLVGVHPVISIATAHAVLAPLAPDPDLMGVTYLMTWAAGVSSSPFSGMHLAMHGRFGVDPRRFVRWNGGFTLFMLLVDVLALHLFAALR